MKRRGGAANPDFKRLKAKVGRKAPKPANATDTSFRSASIRVAAQSGDAASHGASSSFVSGRGKALPELLDKMRNHPASAVRLSSAKGLKDLIQRAAAAPAATATATRKGTTAAAGTANHHPAPPPTHAWLSSHLSTLIPAIARCALMDVDDQVRSCGLDILRLVVLTNESQGSSASIAPFVPLLLAHVSSALNSMDRSVRVDGARATCIICEALQQTASANAMPLSDAAATILPALVRLLKEQSFSVITAETATALASSATAKRGAAGPLSSSSVPSKADTSSRSERKRHEETLTVLRSVLGLLRGLLGADAPSRSTALESPSSAADLDGGVWNPTSIRIVAAGAGYTVAEEQTALFRNVADLARLCRRSNSSAYGAAAGRHHLYPPTAVSAAPSTGLLVDLLERLRDVLLDCGSEKSDAVSAPSLSVRSDLLGAEETVNLVAHILPLAVKMLQASLMSAPVPAQTRKVMLMILSSLVRFVPTMNEGSHQEDISFSTSLQTQICLAIVAVDAALPERPHGARDRQRQATTTTTETPAAAAATTTDVMPAVVEYTVASLRTIGSVAITGANRDVDATATVRFHPHPSVLQLLKNLLESDRPSVSAHRTRLLRAFVAAFFPVGDGPATSHPAVNRPATATGSHENESGNAGEWQRSVAVRRALHLARRVIFASHHYEQYKLESGRGGAASPSDDDRCHEWAALRVLRCTPGLLVSWRSDFIGDSFSALVLLHEAVRRFHVPSILPSPERQPGADTSTDDISVYIAEALTPVFEARRCDGPAAFNHGGITASTFELYPESLQRMALSIFVLLGQLPRPALTALAAICSRSHGHRREHALSLRMAVTVMETVHSIRKRMSMREYLGFVLEASGTLNIQDADADQEPRARDLEPEGDERAELPMRRAVALDRALQVACRLLVECGSASKLLPMLWPFLLSCLGSPGNRSIYQDVLKTRTGVAIVAYLLMYSDGASFLKDQHDVTGVLARSLARLCRVTFAAVEADDPRLTSFLCPALSLISIRQINLLPALFRVALSSDEIQGANTSTRRPVSVFQCLYHLVHSTELRDAVVDCAGELMETVQSYGRSAPASDAGPDQIWLGRLVAELEAVHFRVETGSKS